MIRTRTIATAVLAAATLAASTLPSLAQSMSSDAPKARFSSATVYTGAPALQTTLSMVIAGGGPSAFAIRRAG